MLEALLDPLKTQESGTLVLWEKLDRIVTPGYKANDFNDLIDDIEAHLAMIFHRLIEGPEPQFLLRVHAAWHSIRCAGLLYVPDER